jgi:diguanylate cyclase (GGDEF)-like protein
VKEHDHIRSAEYPIPVREAERLRALAGYKIVGSEPEASFNRLVQLVSTVLGYPGVAINLIEQDRQWTNASVAFDTGYTASRQDSYCARAIVDPTAVLVVPDTQLDPRFFGNPFNAEVRFYAGAPLVTADGYALGALCVTDSVPRHPTAEAMEILRTLAAAVVSELELRRQRILAEEAAARLRELLARSHEEARALSAIAEVTRTLARSTDELDLQGQICAAALEVSGGAGAQLLLRCDAGDFRACASTAGVVAAGVAMDEQSLLGRVCETGEAMFVADLLGDGRVSPKVADRYGAGAAVLLPVGAGPGGTVGALAVWWAEPIDGLSDHARRLLGVLADEAAVALERMSLLSRLETLGRTDPLTGIPNRRAGEEELETEINRARRDGRDVSVAMIDLDRFKSYNDRHGHPAGDRLLKEATAAWRAVLRRSDVLSRYGGEEFALVLAACDGDQAQRVLEGLRAATPGETCSVGIATWDGIETGEQLVSRADRALYRAKSEGRDRVLRDRVDASPSDPPALV